jgi:hypothetical protein
VWKVPDLAPRADPRLANGEVRGLYDVALRPGSDELWTVHLLLATATPQPALDFETTVFPAAERKFERGTGLASWARWTSTRRGRNLRSDGEGSAHRAKGTRVRRRRASRRNRGDLRERRARQATSGMR